MTLRDGDVFGPVVNLAARVVAVGAPNDIVVPDDLAGELDAPTASIGSHQRKGFGDAIALSRVEH